MNSCPVTQHTSALPSPSSPPPSPSLSPDVLTVSIARCRVSTMRVPGGSGAVRRLVQLQRRSASFYDRRFVEQALAPLPRISLQTLVNFDKRYADGEQKLLVSAEHVRRQVRTAARERERERESARRGDGERNLDTIRPLSSALLPSMRFTRRVCCTTPTTAAAVPLALLPHALRKRIAAERRPSTSSCCPPLRSPCSCPRHCAPSSHSPLRCARNTRSACGCARLPLLQRSARNYGLH